MPLPALPVLGAVAKFITVNGTRQAAVKYGPKAEKKTQEQIAKQKELQTAYDNNAYQRSRATEYPPIVDQLDDIYHNGIDAWKATIKAVKDKYPKE